MPAFDVRPRNRGAERSARQRAGAAHGLREAGAAGDADLLEDLRQVVLDRLLGEEQLSRYLAVRAPRRDERGDLALAPAERVQALVARGTAAAGSDLAAHAPPLPGGPLPAAPASDLAAHAPQLAGGLVAQALGAAGGEFALGALEPRRRHRLVARRRG